MARHKQLRGHPAILAFLLLGLTLALACGASATSTPRPSARATPQPVATSAPAPTAMAPAAATAAPRATSRPGPTSRPVPTSQPAQTLAPVPTATPRPTIAAMAPKPKVERLKIALISPAIEGSLNWLQSGSDAFQFIATNEHLLHLDDNGVVSPSLAERWESSPDAKRWTLFLRKGVPWHFGFGDFSAKDIVNSRVLLTQEESIASGVAYFTKTVGNIEVINDHQIVFDLKVPDIDLSWWVSNAEDLLITSKAQWDAEGRDGFAKRLSGTGPYQFVSRTLGQDIVFDAVSYPHHRGIVPDFKTLEMLWASEESTRLAMLLVGEAHITSLETDLERRAESQGMKILVGKFPDVSKSLFFGGLHYLSAKTDPSKLTDAPWKDRRVREAMNRAINRKELIQTFYGDKAIEMYSWLFYSTTPGFNPDWKKNFERDYGYDPAKARALLAEAGYPNGFKMKMATWPSPGTSEELPDLMEAVASAYFRPVGIDVEVELWDKARARPLYVGAGFQCCMYGLGSGFKIGWGNHDTYFGSRRNFVSGYESQINLDAIVGLRTAITIPDRARFMRQIGDNTYKEYATLPIAQEAQSLTVDPNVVEDWPFTGLGKARMDKWDRIKAAR